MNQQPESQVRVPGRIMRFLNLFSWGLFFLLAFLSLFKYLVFGYFSDTVAIFSADFMFVNLAIALFLGSYRAISMFVFNTGYFLIFITLTFINFFHFTPKSFINSLQFYQQLNYSKYILQALLIVMVVLILYFVPKIFFKRVTIRNKIPNIILWVAILGTAFFVQKKYLYDYNTYITNDHTKFKKIFSLVNRGDINSIIEEDRLFAYTFHSKDSLTSYSEFANGISAFEKYPAQLQAPANIQVSMLLESLGRFNSGQAENLLRDSITQWLGPDYALICDSVRFKGSTVDGELRELFNLCGDYNQVIESGKEFNSVFKEKKQQGFLTYSVSSSSGKVFSDRMLYQKGGCDSSFFREDHINLPEFDKEKDIDKESAFSGVRDEFSYDFMLKKMDANASKKQFWYFLTINTHLPFSLNAKDKNSPEYSSFRSSLSEAYSNDVCEHTFKFVQQIRYFVTRAIQHKVGSMVMVGDHSPPYFSATDRGHYSQDYVPVYFIYRKK